MRERERERKTAADQYSKVFSASCSAAAAAANLVFGRADVASTMRT